MLGHFPELTRYPLSLAQELVRILHKALEAAQQEKRVASAYLAAPEDQDRLELVRHKVRQIAELGQRVETLERERADLVHAASLRERELQELQQHVQMLMEKNQAKQQVICKLSEKVTQDFMQHPEPPESLSQQELIEHLKVGDCPSLPLRPFAWLFPCEARRPGCC